MGDRSGGLAIDTSVIVPALLSWHEHHTAALAVVQEALTGGQWDHSPAAGAHGGPCRVDPLAATLEAAP